MRLKGRLGALGFLAFTVLPIVEIALLVELGKRIGTWWTIALVLGTGLLGGVLLALEGYGVVRRLQADISGGRIPQDPIIDGVLVIIGSLFLISPGVLTDAAGILLLFPPTRFLARTGVKRWIAKFITINL
ncbi:MAG TPA: FxsA family protein [Firmicutes bacterium]|nr:FxsA family protein [Candidatus Fermentithermobacillaceae bacterium]